MPGEAENRRNIDLRILSITKFTLSTGPPPTMPALLTRKSMRLMRDISRQCVAASSVAVIERNEGLNADDRLG